MAETEKEQRWEIFRALLPYYGKKVTPDFLRNTSQYILGIERVHPLIEGIYKPNWTDHALSIRIMLESEYADEITPLPDDRWAIRYSAKKGGEKLAINQGLFICMKNKEPVIVLKQITDKYSRQGSRYRLMGLGLIDSYDPSSGTFMIHHVDYATLEQVSQGTDDEIFIASALREFTLEKFSPFVSEDKAIYRLQSKKEIKHLKMLF